MTNLSQSNTGDVIAALTTAMTSAASQGEGFASPSMADLHVSIVSPPGDGGAPLSAAARVLQRGELSTHVEARLTTPRGELIAFAVGRLDAPGRFAPLSATAAPEARKPGVLRTIWEALEEMGG